MTPILSPHSANACTVLAIGIQLCLTRTLLYG